MEDLRDSRRDTMDQDVEMVPQLEHILCFDPGGTTGIAQYAGLNIFRTHHLGPGVHHLELWNFLLKYRPSMVIYEEFQYQRRELDKGVSLEIISREYIGIIRLYAEMVNIRCHKSTLNKLKFWDDTKLKKVNLWSSVIHERDALRHLLYYLSFDKEDSYWLAQLQGETNGQI